MGYDDEAPPRDEVGQARQKRGRGPEAQFAGGVLIGAAVLGVVWLLVAMLNGGSSDAPDRAGNANIVGPQAGSSAGRTSMASMARCTTAATALSVPLRAAGPAMDQWAVHIGAMNKLVVGAITLQQANAFWNRTRVGAVQRISQFRHAMQTVREDGVDCPSSGMLSRKASAGLRSCVRQVEADLATVQVARTAINTWSMHVRDMERLRNGTLSPATASRMWLSMWQRGAQQLQNYRLAARTSGGLEGCTGAAGTPGSLSSQRPTMGPSAGSSMGPSMDMDGAQ